MDDQTSEVTFTLNGKVVSLAAEDRTLLADALRDLGSTGTKLGCNQGVCGSCTVSVDGVLIRSCLRFAHQVGGSDVETVESLQSDDGTLGQVQRSFSKYHALQCGFCTPGFLMVARSIVEEAQQGHRFDRVKVRDRLGGNICRCTGYQPIIDAVWACIPAEQRDDSGHGTSNA